MSPCQQSEGWTHSFVTVDKQNNKNNISNGLEKISNEIRNRIRK